MTEPLQPFPHFIHFLERVELSANECIWARRRVRDELRYERKARMRDADASLFKLLERASRYLDHLAKQGFITARGADDLAGFLLIASRRVMRECDGWAPAHDRREEAEKLWKRAQPRRSYLSLDEAVTRLRDGLRRTTPTKEASCGKQ